MVRICLPLKTYEMWKKPVVPENQLAFVNQNLFPRKVKLVSLGLSVLSGCAMYLINTAAGVWTKVLVEETREDGQVAVPSRKLRRLKDIAASELHYPDAHKVKIYSSTSDSPDVYGFVKSRFGAYIGLPSYLKYEKEEDVTISVSPSLPTDEANEIISEFKKNSLFSEDAKLYVIAEGLLFVKEPHYFMMMAFATSFCVLMVAVQSRLSRKYLSLGTMENQNSIYIQVACMMWGSALIALIDRINFGYYKNAIDCLNAKYVNGGIEYYEKLLIRTQIKIDHVHMWVLDLGIMKYFKTVFTDRLSVLKDRQKKLECT